jgi:ABC-type branched-subunit amino acid transport system ATPase component
MTVLCAHDLRVRYGEMEVVHGIDLRVDAGEVVVILGANGAGKTSTLLALAGAINSTGNVELLGSPARGAVHQRARGGVAFLPEDRGVVRALTVEDNLRLARVPPAVAFHISPELEPLRDRAAGQLSGGEQQILALTRAIATKPKLLLADELSFGLAPIVVSRMLALVRSAAENGAAVLVVDQYARRALEIADRAYVLQRGEVAVAGDPDLLSVDIEAIERSYLGDRPASLP